jgi:hypothetical protein
MRPRGRNGVAWSGADQTGGVSRAIQIDRLITSSGTHTSSGEMAISCSDSGAVSPIRVARLRESELVVA